MNSPTIVDALISLNPQAEYAVISNGTVDDIQWLTEGAKPTNEEIQAEITRLETKFPWDKLRQQRNRLIAETDYLALSDATLTDDMTTYRQALRDLPANTTDPANPVWPTKPGGAS